MHRHVCIPIIHLANIRKLMLVALSFVRIILYTLYCTVYCCAIAQIFCTLALELESVQSIRIVDGLRSQVVLDFVRRSSSSWATL